jgi:homoserine/homoserine lactone efflux protein
MIDPNLYAAFVAAVVVLMLIPGPNVALIVANSVAHGPRFGLLTVAGTTSAMIVQLGFTALGMAPVLNALGFSFEWLRWIGVVYLAWLGVAQWCALTADLTRTSPEPRSERFIVTRAFLVSLTNPKTLLFYGAFLPQFIDPAGRVGAQMTVLAVTFLVLAAFIDSGWALLAARVRRLLETRERLRNRLSGGLLLGAGAALAMARRQ